MMWKRIGGLAAVLFTTIGASSMDPSPGGDTYIWIDCWEDGWSMDLTAVTGVSGVPAYEVEEIGVSTDWEAGCGESSCEAEDSVSDQDWGRTSIDVDDVDSGWGPQPGQVTASAWSDHWVQAFEFSDDTFSNDWNVDTCTEGR
jgi:hypothetical protein